MKVKLDRHKNVLKIQKDISAAETDAESVGLALIRGPKSRRLFQQKILQLVRVKDYLNKFWLEIFNSLVMDGLNIKVAEIAREDWQEVDFHPDVHTIRQIVLKEG